MRRKSQWIASLVFFLLVVLGASPWLVRTYWAARDSNPVRRGLDRAAELGCFSCHGSLGQRGLPDPGVDDLDVPTWQKLATSRSLRDDSAIREAIVRGSFPPHDDPAIEMPAFESVLDGSDLDDLVAAFRVLSGKSVPASGSRARRGLDRAFEWRCFQCHGFAGSGGIANPRSFSGSIPGWYGPAFDDLVRNRDEFNEWILTGSLSRIDGHAIASYFTRRQRVPRLHHPRC